MPNTSSIPGYQQNEYLLIIKPHEELWNRIIKIKEEFAAKYNAPIAKVLRPHIALVSFNAWAIAEEKIYSKAAAYSHEYPTDKSGVEQFRQFSITHYLYKCHYKNSYSKHCKANKTGTTLAKNHQRTQTKFH